MTVLRWRPAGRRHKPMPLSSTRIELVRWRFGLLAGTVIVLACALLSFVGAANTISAVHDNGLPSVVYSLNAARAVVSANQAVATNFATTTDIALTGTGRDYQADLALATQSLEQVAGINQAGAAGSQAIQSVDGQLATYTELIGQADADFARGESTVGAAQAWHAAQLMESADGNIHCSARTKSGGVLDDLSILCGAELSAVDARGSSFWTSWVAVLLWIGPSVLLLAALLRAQRYLARRFQRTYNWPLVIATGLLFMLAVGGGTLIVSDQLFASARAELHTAVVERDNAIGAIDMDGKAKMVALVQAQCASRTACGPTIQNAVATLTNPAPTTDNSIADLASARTDLDSADAWSATVYVFAIIGVALAAWLSVLIGFQLRISEYRYQS